MLKQVRGKTMFFNRIKILNVFVVNLLMTSSFNLLGYSLPKVYKKKQRELFAMSRYLTITFL